MPNVFVVDDQRNLADLASVLLRRRVSATVRESAWTAIRRANPGVDFDRLTPGTVVVVPSVDGTRPEAPADPVRGAVTDLTDRLQEGVRSLAGATDAAEETRGAEKKEAQDLFGTAMVKRLAAQEPELATNIESVRATFKQDDVSARRQLVELRKSLESWSADLATLRGLL